VRIGRLTAVAVVAVAGLAAVITITAVSSANGAPRGQILYRHSERPSTPLPAVELGDCAPAAGRGRSALQLEGTCHGLLKGPFACVADGELAALSVRRPIGEGRTLYLTFLIPEFAGPGEYTQDEITAQVVGPEHVPRWSSRGSYVDIVVTPNDVYEIGNAVLLPEAGTPATGVITLHGRAVCR